MKNWFQFLIYVSIILSSCKVDNTIYRHTYNTAPEYSWGYAEFYGQFYGQYNIDKNVVTLSLFSDSLFITDEGSLDGFGQYLFIEDIFSSSSDILMPEGTYTASKSYEPFTFAPGEFFEVDGLKYRIGAYIYYIEEKSAYSVIKNISRGSFTLNYTDSTQHIICDFVLEDSTKLKGSFEAELPYFDQSTSSPKTQIRKKLTLRNPIE